jgi:hypothetical protein
MTAMMPLGSILDLETSATTANGRVPLRNATGVLFVVIGATSGAATIQEHNAASSGTSQNLATITEYYRKSSGAWTRVTQAAAATVTAGTGGLLAVWVPATSLSDSFTHVSISHGSASAVYILSGLKVGRKPANLASTAT